MGIDGDKDVLWAKIIKNKYTWEWSGGGGERCSKAQVIFVKKKI